MEQTESLKYWLKASAVAAIPRPGDWACAAQSGVDFAIDFLIALTTTLFRLVVLVTFPVSVPLLAIVARRYNAKAVEHRARARKELIDSMTRKATDNG